MFQFAKRLATAPFKAVTPKSKSQTKSRRSSLRSEDVPDVMYLRDTKPHVVDLFVSSPVLTVSVTQKGRSDQPDVFVVAPNETNKVEEASKAESEAEKEEGEQPQQDQDTQHGEAPTSPPVANNV